MKKNENEATENELELEEVDMMEIKLSKEYKFEDQTISKLELKGLEDITCRQMIEAQKFMDKQGSYVAQENKLEYACFMASKVTGLPIEFFYELAPKDAMALKNSVTYFFYTRG